MTLEKARAPVAGGLFCLAAALGGVAKAAEVYPRMRPAGPDRKNLVGRSGQWQNAGRRRGRLPGAPLELVARRPLF